MFINTNSLLVVVDMLRDFVTGVLNGRMNKKNAPN